MKLTKILLCAFITTSAQAATPEPEVCFSPKGNCTDLLVDKILSAKQSVYIQAYGFTSKPIADALIAKSVQGKDIQIILDEKSSSQKNSVLPQLRANKINVWLDGKHAIAHNKIIIIDGHIVELGSFNFTKQAEVSNAENLIIIDSVVLADKYKVNFLLHKFHSQQIK